MLRFIPNVCLMSYICVYYHEGLLCTRMLKSKMRCGGLVAYDEIAPFKLNETERKHHILPYKMHQFVYSIIRSNVSK